MIKHTRAWDYNINNGDIVRFRNTINNGIYMNSTIMEFTDINLRIVKAKEFSYNGTNINNTDYDIIDVIDVLTNQVKWHRKNTKKDLTSIINNGIITSSTKEGERS